MGKPPREEDQHRSQHEGEQADQGVLQQRCNNREYTLAKQDMTQITQYMIQVMQYYYIIVIKYK